MKILYCHGLDGSPQGRKPTTLRNAGHEVTAPELPRDDFARSVRIARAAVQASRPDVLVGSSRGGAVAMRIADDGLAPLVLLAPAWRIFDVQPSIRSDTRILHSIKDVIVPLADSIELEQRNNLPAENLIPVNDDHRLGSPLALEALLQTVARLAGYRSHDTAPRHNQIRVIRPYLWEGMWVFDDPAVGLDKEPFVAGVPEMIERATGQLGIANPERGFVMLFSDESFPSAQMCLEWVREEGGGNIYRWPESNLEGWLCPALLRYFTHAPKHLYVEIRPAQSR